MKTYKHQLGMSMIEVLTSVAVLSVGLISTSSLSLLNLKSTSFGQNQSQATILADELADTMRLNLTAYESSLFADTPDVGEKDCLDETTCTFDEQAQYDSNAWVQRAAQALPAGVAVMCMDSTPDDGQPDNPACDGTGMNTIKLFWADTRNPEALPEGEAFYRHVVSLVP